MRDRQASNAVGRVGRTTSIVRELCLTSECSPSAPRHRERDTPARSKICAGVNDRRSEIQHQAVACYRRLARKPGRATC